MHSTTARPFFPLVRVLAVVAAATLTADAKPPTVDRLFPAGAQRGQTATVTAEGSFERWPVRAWTDSERITVTAENEKGKLAIKVAADATPGLHWLRLYDDEGAAALRPFFVGTLPEVTEGTQKGAAPTFDPPRVTVNGRLTRRGEVDEFVVPLKAGETLVAAVEANTRLGSPMDAVLQVTTPDGFVLAQQDDDQGLDPLLVFTAKAAGPCHVRLFAFPAVADSTIAFAGGNTFIYRLTLTTGGFVDYAYPLAVLREHGGPVEARGWNIPEEARRLEPAQDGTPEAAVVSHPRLANSAAVRLEGHASVTEREPNDRDHPQALELPVTVTGQIAPARDADVFQFPGKKGQPLRFRVEARTLGSPLDPVLRVTDKDGKTLVEVDDTGKARDAELTFSPAADGVYRVQVRDLHGDGGDRYFYRLTATPVRPDFGLSLADDRFTLAPGAPLKVPVKVDRKDGFDGTIEVRAEDLPDGVDCPPVRSEPKGSTARSVTLTLSAKGAGPRSAAIQVVGAAGAASRPARVPIAGFEPGTTRAWLTVLPSAAKK